jgi:hypothetical protein
MSEYAVLDSANKVINIIVADSLEIAQNVTKATCILVTNETEYPVMGLGYADGVFEQPARTPATVEEIPE